MNLLSIDFSINHTALNLFKENQYYFYSIQRENKFTKKVKNLVDEMEQTKLYKAYYIKELQKDTNYSKNEINKIQDSNNINKIVKEIIEDNKIDKVKIEGFAFSSQGRSVLDIGGYAYLLRNEIKNLNKEINILSPGSIKKCAGKGNYNKVQMFEAFIENKQNDEILNNNIVYNFIKQNLEKININNKRIEEPFAGLIDAYWITQTKEL